MRIPDRVTPALVVAVTAAVGCHYHGRHGPSQAFLGVAGSRGESPVAGDWKWGQVRFACRPVRVLRTNRT